MIKAKKLFKKLNVQLITVFCLLIVVYILITTVFLYQKTFDTLNQNTELLHIQTMEQSQIRIQNKLDELEKMANILVIEDASQSILSYTVDERVYDSVMIYNDFFGRVDDLLFYYPYINSIYFYNNSFMIGANRIHRTIESSPASLDLLKESIDSYTSWEFIGGLKERFFNPVESVDNQDSGIITMTKIERVPYSNFKNGYIAININEELFFDTVLMESDNTNLSLLNSDMQIISSHDKNTIGQTYDKTFNLDFSKNYSSVITYENGLPVLNISYKVGGTDLWLLNHVKLTDLVQDSNEIIMFTTITMLIGIFILISIVSIWLNKKLHPLKELVYKMDEIKTGKIGLTVNKIPKNELGIVITKFNEMTIALDELMRNIEESNSQKNKQELLALQAQLNPHFIFNTLNMIKWMAIMDGSTNIVESITALGCILEPIFKNNGVFWTLSNELDYLQHYIKIMGWRYGNTCIVECLIPDECKEKMIPRFILQPIMENCVTHGMPKEKSIHIIISSQERDSKLWLTVHNTGNSISEKRLSEIKNSLEKSEKKEKGHVGLYNVNRRIRLNFGESYGLEINSKEKCGTTVSLSLPILEAEDTDKLNQSDLI